MPDPVGLEQLDDPGDLVDRARLAGVHGQTEPELARPPEEPPVVGDAEGRRFGAGDVDPDDAPVAPADRLLDDDLVELEREGAVEAEDESRLDRVLETRPCPSRARRRR